MSVTRLDPPAPGRYILHTPKDHLGFSAAREILVEDRGDGVLVWTDPWTGGVRGTAPWMIGVSADHRFERVEEPPTPR